MKRSQKEKNLSWLNKLKNSPLASAYKATILPRAQKKLELIAPMLEAESKVLDIGCGNAGLSKLLMEKGHKVTCIDVVDNSFFPEVKPLVYDGRTFPFKEITFDAAIFMTVLHHIPDDQHIDLLKQAMRVANKVIVMEDIFTHGLGQKVTHFTDSLVNLEFKGHPHSNRTNKAWKQLFDEAGLVVANTKHTKTLQYFRQVVYELHPRN